MEPLFSKVAVLFHIPASTCMRILIPTLTSTCIVCLCDYSHSRGCVVVSHCGFKMHFLPRPMMLNIFYCSYLPFIFFLWKKCLFISSEAYVIFCPVHLRRIKFGRTTVAFYFFVCICGITINNNQCVPLFFIMYGHDTQSHPFHTSINSLL